jgi:hypothetical protein
VAQLYRPRRKGQPFALLGNFQVHGEDEAILPAEDVASAPPPTLTPELDAYLRQSLGSMVQLFTVGDPTAAKNYTRSEALWSPCMYLLNDGGKTTCVSFAMSSGPRALAAAPRLLAQEAGTTMAVFVYDHDLFVDGQPARELRFVAHAPGMAQAAVYAQSYMEPHPSRPFTLVGDLRPLSAGPALFC